MMLADMGAEVLRLARLDSWSGRFPEPGYDVHQRGKRIVRLDLKRPEGVQTALRLVERADCLIEGFRPGVMERLGLGPDACLARNPRLVYGRMTGWGQTGPLAGATRHDIDHIGLTRSLSNLGPECPPR